MVISGFPLNRPTGERLKSSVPWDFFLWPPVGTGSFGLAISVSPSAPSTSLRLERVAALAQPAAASYAHSGNSAEGGKAVMARKARKATAKKRGR
jgi:hypothetical protein